MFFIDVDGAQSSSRDREISTSKKRTVAQRFSEHPDNKLRDFHLEMDIARKKMKRGVATTQKHQDEDDSSVESFEVAASKRGAYDERYSRPAVDDLNKNEDESSMHQKPFQVSVLRNSYITRLNDLPSTTPQSVNDTGRSYHGVDEKRLKSELMKIFAMIMVLFLFLYLLFLSGSNAYNKHDDVDKYSSLDHCINCVNAAYANPDQEFFMKPCESQFDHIYNCSSSRIFTTFNASASNCAELNSLDNFNVKGGMVHVNSTFNYIVTFWIAISVYIFIIAGAAVWFYIDYDTSLQHDFFGGSLTYLLLVTFFWWLFTILFLTEVHNTGTFTINGIICIEKRIPNKIDGWLATLFIILWTLPLQAIIAAIVGMLDTVAMELFFVTLAILFLTMIAIGHIGDSDLTYVFGGGMVVIFGGVGAFVLMKYKQKIRKDKESYI